MRLLLFFDLPVKKKEDREAYTHFRRFLLKDGYDMIQYSVYSRICKGLDGVEKHSSRLENHLPEKGHIRSMIVTEKQYAEMSILIGNKTSQERNLSADQITIF